MNKTLLVLALSISSTALGCAETPATLGAREARRDIEAGDLRVKTYGGPPAPWTATYVSRLRLEYGITVDWVAGCVVDESTRAFADAYNEVSEAVIKQRFGAGLLSRIAEESQRASERPDEPRART